MEAFFEIDKATELNIIYYQRQLTEGVPTVMLPTGVSGSGSGAAAAVTGSGSGVAAAVTGSSSGVAAAVTGSSAGVAAAVTGSGSGAAATVTGSGSGAAAAAAVTRQVDGMVEDVATEPDPKKDKDAINPLRHRSPAAAPQLAKVKQTQPFVLVFCSPWWGGVS